MTIEGDLRVSLVFDGRSVRDVAVRSTRPHAVGVLLRGRDVATVPEIVSRVHAVCGAAQAVAAAGACAAARDGAVAPRALAARSTLVGIEAIQEHCTRLGLGWPAVMNDAPLLPLVRAVRAATLPLVERGLRSLLHDECPDDQDVAVAMQAVATAVADTLLGMSCDAWLALDGIAHIEAWSRTGSVAPARWLHTLLREHPTLGVSSVPPMPAATRDALQAAVIGQWRASPAFVEHPAWDDNAVETGSIACMQAHPLVAAVVAAWGNSVASRLVARLTQLASLLQSLASGGTTANVDAFGTGRDGYGASHTARGLLLHRARVQDGHIDDYAIVAPTEWNFRAGGAFTRALTGLVAPDEAALMRSARLVAQAMDPCVACTIEVAHA